MKTKLLFIYGPLGGGGAERVLIDLLSNLDYSLYEVDLCLMVNGGILLPEVPKEVNIIPLWQTYSLYYKLAYRFSKWGISNYLFQRVLNKKLNKKYDVTISFLEGMPVKLHALMKTNAPKITWVHCDLFNFPYEKGVFAEGEDIKVYNQVDEIICVSEDAQKAFYKRFPPCTQPVSVIYNPVDLQKVKRMAAMDTPKFRSDKLEIISVGRLTPQKKIDRILRLATKMKLEKRAVHFSILGDGELKEELKQQCKDMGVEDYVSFLGFQPNPYSYIKQADILLLPSGYEGFGLVVVEAMALGIPVVSTKTAGPMEIIGNDEFGLLCEHDDTSIYDAVIKILDGKDLRKNYIEKGKQRADNFDVKRMIEGFDGLVVKTLRK